MINQEIENEIENLTFNLMSKDIVTLIKGDIQISASCLKPPIGVEEDDSFLPNAILTLLHDGWTAIPF